MYTNINTGRALKVIATFLDTHPLAIGLPANVLVAAL
jgi:hypothetical protein